MLADSVKSSPMWLWQVPANFFFISSTVAPKEQSNHAWLSNISNLVLGLQER